MNSLNRESPKAQQFIWWVWLEYFEFRVLYSFKTYLCAKNQIPFSNHVLSSKLQGLWGPSPEIFLTHYISNDVGGPTTAENTKQFVS